MASSSEAHAAASISHSYTAPHAPPLFSFSNWTSEVMELRAPILTVLSAKSSINYLLL